MANLYELSQEYLELIEIASNGADSKEELEKVLADLDKVNSSIDEKVQNGIALIKSLQNLSTGMHDEILRLQYRKKSIDEHIDNIKFWYLKNLELQKRSNVKTSLGSMIIRNNPPKLNIFNESQVPDKYKIEIPAHFELDKNQIKNALKNKKIIPGCSLTSSKTIVIR